MQIKLNLFMLINMRTNLYDGVFALKIMVLYYEE